MREFCWTCHRSVAACFCALTRPFESAIDFALIVHPYEAKATIGTAWILRRSISNIKWFRSKGCDLDQNACFLETLNAQNRVPFLLFPGSNAFNLSQDSAETWSKLVPSTKRPLFIIVDGTWTQAKGMVRKSRVLSSLPRVSFETSQPSQYEFKKQPRPSCLSSVESVHRVIEVMCSRSWAMRPASNEHDQMISIFRNMVRFQLQYIPKIL